MSLLDTLAGPPTPPPAKDDGDHRVELIPYNAIYDPQASDFLGWMWRQMQKDDLVDYYFPGQKETGFAVFVRMMSGEASVALVKIAGDSNQWGDRIGGFVSWSPLHLGASPCVIGGFLFFRRWWDHRTTDETARLIFRQWFEGGTKVVLGVCPALHHAALRYNKRVGLREMGRIPMAHLYKGEVCDAVLVGITREEWEARCR